MFVYHDKTDQVLVQVGGSILVLSRSTQVDLVSDRRRAVSRHMTDATRECL